MIYTFANNLLSCAWMSGREAASSSRCGRETQWSQALVMVNRVQVSPWSTDHGIMMICICAYTCPVIVNLEHNIERLSLFICYTHLFGAWLASFPGLLHVHLWFLIACSIQKWREKAWGIFSCDPWHNRHTSSYLLSTAKWCRRPISHSMLATKTEQVPAES